MWSCWLVLVVGSDNILNQILSPGVMFTVCIIKILRINIRIFSICFELRSNIILRGNGDYKFSIGKNTHQWSYTATRLYLFVCQTCLCSSYKPTMLFYLSLSTYSRFKLWFMSMIILHRLFLCCCDCVIKNKRPPNN